MFTKTLYIQTLLHSLLTLMLKIFMLKSGTDYVKLCKIIFFSERGITQLKK